MEFCKIDPCPTRCRAWSRSPRRQTPSRSRGSRPSSWTTGRRSACTWGQCFAVYFRGKLECPNFFLRKLRHFESKCSLFLYFSGKYLIIITLVPGDSINVSSFLTLFNESHKCPYFLMSQIKVCQVN
jgi:hypothetical protein